MVAEENFDEDSLATLLPVYYRRLFPIDGFFQWLSYGSDDLFCRREISFTLIGDIYLRYQSFESAKLFLMELTKKFPVKIDIGAVYVGRPRERTPMSRLQPVQKEMVFDIDMTDYDHIRTCCQGADVCLKCWKFMAMGCKILDAALREDFGFSNILWVFSGRRGIHCWVADEDARMLDDSARSAVAEYLQVTSDGENNKKLKLTHIHPSIERALQIIEKYFVDAVIMEQDILGTNERLTSFLGFLDESVRPTFESKMSKGKSSLERWTIFENTFDELQQKNQLPRFLKHLKEELKLHYSYPRLDINVTKSLNHLLKAPFCVHPKTGKICVPFSVKAVDSFDPHNVPNITQLMDEINSYDAKTKEQAEAVPEQDTDSAASKPNVKDYKKTSLLKPMMLFQNFLRGLEKANNLKKKKAADESMNF